MVTPTDGGSLAGLHGRAWETAQSRRRWDEQWSAYLYDERTVENFGTAADEGRVVGGQRAGSSPEGCAGENRSHRGHVFVDECADTVGAADLFAAETRISEAGDDASAAERRRVRPAVDDAQDV